MGRQQTYYHRKYSYKHNIRKKFPSKQKSFPVSLPLNRIYPEMIVSLPIQPIFILKKNIQSCSLPTGWALVNTTNNEIFACLLHDSKHIPEVQFSITISENLQYKITAFGRSVNLPTTTSIITNVEDFLSIIKILKNCNICPGNNDIDFVQLAKQRNGNFIDRTGM